jgi:hypothetical protein
MVPRSLAWLAVCVLVVACTAVTPSPTATPVPQPSPSSDASLPPRTPPPSREPQPTASPTPAPTGLMVVTLLPAEDPVEARPAIPGERVCFLVQVDDRSLDDGDITFAATGDGLAVDSVPSTAPSPGEVGEVWVTIDPAVGTEETVATLELTVSHGGADPVDWVEQRSILVYPQEDSRAEIAQQYFDFWVAWLAAEHPELGITESTAWDSTYVSALLIVSKYAYWSDEWEMVVAWHEMIPPSDFTEVYLRRRDSETAYSLSFRQESFSGNTPPHQVNPTEQLIR